MGTALKERVPMRNAVHFIEHDGVRLRYRIEGGGPAVVLIHGWTLDLDMWQPQFAALAPAHRMLAFDRRGYGYSSGTPDLERDVGDLGFLLDELQIRHVALVGMSQGARVALGYAAKFPARVSCLVLDGPAQQGNTSDGPAVTEMPMSEFRALVAEQGIDAFREAWLRHAYMHLFTDNVETHSLLREIIQRYPGHDLLGAETKLAPVQADLSGIEAPTLIINGEFDSQQRRRAGARLSSSLANAQLASVPQAGHLANLDNPTAYNGLIAEFVRTHAHASKVVRS
jgi:pimeloyl-ACP methyl ester carboxylesterase